MIPFIILLLLLGIVFIVVNFFVPGAGFLIAGLIMLVLAALVLFVELGNRRIEKRNKQILEELNKSE